VITDFSVFLEKPDCRFQDVGGCEEALRVMRKVKLYLTDDPAFQEWGPVIPSGILLVGKPGVGKTLSVRALAGEINRPVYAPPPTAFLDMWAGNTEKNILGMWKAAEKNAPAVIFIDEIDGFCSRRTSGGSEGSNWYNRAVVTVLHLLSNIREAPARVVLIGATNRIEDIDEAFLRPGRFDEIVTIHRPDVRALAQIWLIELARAEQRALRVDFLSEQLRRAIRCDRREWVETHTAEGAADSSGLMAVARLCEEKEFTGADVGAILRGVIDNRVLATSEMGVNLGPITPEDIRIQAELYERPQGLDDSCRVS